MGKESIAYFWGVLIANFGGKWVLGCVWLIAGFSSLTRPESD